MTPLARYHQAINEQIIEPDETQLALSQHLNNLSAELNSCYSNVSWLTRLLGYFKKHRIKGVYIWGEVGRGKTLLMDWFYDSLLFQQKTRCHFHRFMQDVHHALKEAQAAKQKNPLQRVAEAWAKNTRVICFDEFFVSDVADAMILAELLQALYEQQVVILYTSNTPVLQLYRGGVQRDRFIPAIKKITAESLVWELAGHCDYRLRTLTQTKLSVFPLNNETKQKITDTFSHLSKQSSCKSAILKINDRNFYAVACVDDIVWFEFEQLCIMPRGQYDYIELARQFHTVVISGVPVFSEALESAARRFVSLVDEFYDRNVKLVLQSAAPLPELYQGRLLQEVFVRTTSRLTEMQTHAYLAKPHLP